MTFDTDRYVVYILHFERPVGRSLHYCGSTTSRRFERRMVEHQTGQGASLTRRAVTAGVGWWITGMFETTNRRLEKRLKNEGHLPRKCLRCGGADIGGLTNRATQRFVAPQRPASNWGALGW